MTESLEKFTLLLVDDNPTNLSLLAQIVEMDLPQVRVFTARSAIEGLQLAADHPMDGAFVDVQMPGMSGLDMCRRLKEDPRFCHVPVVMMTAHIATAELRAEGLDAGAYDFISQPISNVEMLARVKVMLRLRQSERSLQNANDALRKQVAYKTSTLRWLSGLLLAGGDEVAEEDRELATKLGARLPQDSRFDIELFNGPLLQEMPLRWRRTVQKLALLDEIPLHLAERLAEIADIEGALDYLWRHNFFIDQPKEGAGIYRLHSELKDRLREQATRDLSRQDREETYSMAACWYCQRGQTTTALDYLLTADLYSEAELLLSQRGAVLLSGEQLPQLGKVLEKIPEDLVVKRGWLALFIGITSNRAQAKEPEGWLELAHTHFVSREDWRGELLVLTQLVVQHLLVDGRFDLGRQVLPRLKELLEQNSEQLDLLSQVCGFRALAIGETFFDGRLELADYYVREGLQLAVKADAIKLQFNLRLVSAYLALLRGRLSLVHAELETSQSMLRRLAPTEPSRFSQKVMFCDLLLRSGDYINSRVQQNQLEQTLGKTFVQQSPMGPILCQYQVECLLAEGRQNEARDLIDLCSTAGLLVFNSHLRSLVLQYRALLWIDDSEREASALLDLQESMRLREVTGGLRHTLTNWVVAAVCYTQQGDYERAEQLLAQALELSISQGEMLVRGGIYARQADLFRRQDREQKALVPLQSLLKLLEDKQQETFFLLTPELLSVLLPLAITHRLLPDLTRKLAKRHLHCNIREDGSFLPLLEIVTLGPSGFYMQGKPILSCSELGSISRQILDSLIMAPNQKLGVDFLLGILWPESSLAKARASFDSNLSRLRKIFDALLKSGYSRDYLVMEKGVLSLQNVIIDCLLFSDAVQKGQQHARRQELWQAGLAFCYADHLWQGEFLSGQDLSDDLIADRHKLTEQRLDMIEVWSDLLAYVGVVENIEALLLEGIRLDPTRDQLVRRAYRHYLASNDAVKAKRILDNYRQALLLDDFPADEAEEIVLMMERDESPLRTWKKNNDQY